MAKDCSRRRLEKFLSNHLDLDDQLIFLFHVENCRRCWNTVYDVAKAQHPHYYQESSWRLGISEKELSRLEAIKPELVEVA